MFPITHTYILKKIYQIKKKPLNTIPSEILLGNVLPDMVVDFELRKKQNFKNFHLEVHDRIKGPGQIGYNLRSRIETGIALHVMSDNYSRVGSYWRSGQCQKKVF